MTHATPADTDATSRVAYRALLGFTYVVAAVTFVLSFHGLDDYGRRVAQVGILSPLVPVAVDGLTLVAVFATLLLRHAKWTVRAYAWFVFAVAVALSIGGNLAHAASRHLTVAGKVGAAASPILLALASHLVIVTRRAIERADARRVIVAATVEKPATPSVRVAVADPVASAPTRTEETPVAPRAPQRRAAKPPKTHRAPSDTAEQSLRLWSAGNSHAEIALALGVSKKTAERHTESLRLRGAGDGPGTGLEDRPVGVAV